MKRMTKVIICFLLILSLGITVNAAGAVPEKVIKATESVVRILSKYSDGYGTGTGFVIKSNRDETLIITNHHVVEDNPYSISVWIDDEEQVNAEILASTNQKDICVLRLTQQISLKPVTLSQSSAKQGDAVYAVGFPAAADILSDTEAHTSQDATITDGIVSAKREVTTTQYGTPVEILQISAAINSGNSGGPLFDINGNVVGVNTYGIADAQGIFGAIDISEIHAFLDENGISVDSGSIVPILIAVSIGVAVLAVVCAVITGKKKKVHKMKSKKQSLTLRNFMSAYPNGLGINDAVALLLPVALQLRDMHNNGQAHLQVSPDTIVVNTTAKLLAPTGSEADRYTSGFAAKEVYGGSGRGMLSDIYSFCAVLFYVSSGLIPTNALQRGEEELYTNENTTFAQIINQGMKMQPEDRFDTMQSVILKLSEYNVKPFVPTEEIPEVKTTASKKKRISSKDKILIAISAIVVVIVVGYLGSYLAALNFAKKGEYSSAENCLLVPPITTLHDKQLPVYIEAGSLMDHRQYVKAKELFESIPGYLNSDIMVLEVEYCHAAQLADSNDFDNAYRKYTLLAAENYKDSKAKAKEVRYRRGLYILYEEQNYLKAYNYLSNSEYNDMNDISEIRNELKELLYIEAVNLYREEELDQADTRFLEDYKDGDKYKLLIKTRRPYYGWFGLDGDIEKDVKKLIDMFSFEDTAEVLVSNTNLACEFLLGNWKTSNGGYYFKIEKQKGGHDYYSSYNIPWYGGTFTIEDGVYMVTQGNYEDKPQYKFTLLTPNSMDLYCYKDGKTYTLYRQ